MIFMLINLVWGLTQQMKRNVEHFVHETRPRTCDQMVFKIIKKQTKSENYEIDYDMMVSYVEAVVKTNWEGFVQVLMYAPYKSKYLRRRFLELRSSHSDFVLK